MGIDMIKHRYLSHRSFEFNNVWIRRFFLLIASLTMQGPLLFWVIIHRQHHTHSDRDNDPHGPHQGFFGTYVGTTFQSNNKEKALIVKDYFKDKDVIFFSKYHWLINILYMSILYLLFGSMGPVAYYLFPGFYAWFVANMVNYLAHQKSLGYRNYEIKDNSVNIRWLAYFSYGGALHNNHHADPRNPFFSRKKKESDSTGMFISLLNKFNLVTVDKKFKRI